MRETDPLQLSVQLSNSKQIMMPLLVSTWTSTCKRNRFVAGFNKDFDAVVGGSSDVVSASFHLKDGVNENSGSGNNADAHFELAHSLGVGVDSYFDFDVVCVSK